MWVVKLADPTPELATLAQSLSGVGISISNDGQDYELTSAQFVTCDDTDSVKQKAEEIVSILNGVSRLVLDGKSSFRVGAVYKRREDGRRDITVFTEPINIRVGTFVTTSRLTHMDGTIEEIGYSDTAKQCIGVALQKDSVANVLRILESKPHDWVNLYRIFEIVASDVGGMDKISEMKWATKSKMRLFKHTANSPEAVGLEARHGVQSEQSPKQPMKIFEAQTMVKSIVRDWINAKSS